MAILQLQDGTTYTQLNDITQELAALNVQLNHWSIGDNPEIRRLLAEQGRRVERIERIVPSLEDVFVSLIEAHDRAEAPLGEVKR